MMNNTPPSFLITGPSRAGKSTLAYQILHYIQGRGFSTGGVITLQNSTRWLYLIQSGKRVKFEVSNDEPFVEIGRFRINRPNLEIAIQHIKDARELDFLFIDEIGILEMNGKGYFPVLEMSFSRLYGNILVVRESIFDWFKSHFDLNFDYEVINCRFDKNSSYLRQMKRKIDKDFPKR